jgi:membrane fusion protein, multidrug efflux system
MMRFHQHSCGVRGVLLACLIAAGFAGSTACSSDTNAAGAEKRTAAPAGGRAGGGAAVPVTTATAVQKAVPLTLKAIGTVTPYSTVDIRAQITGQLNTIHFTEGQDVTAGQLLFTIDPRPFESSVRQAEAVLAKDTAQAKNAETQRSRVEDLFKRGLISREEYDTQVSTAESLNATLAADRAQVENAKLQLQYTSIKAPVSGRTGALNVHVGDLIRANDTTPLVVINQLTPIFVTFSVPGQMLANIRQYQRSGALSVAAEVPQGQQAPSSGVVSFIDNTVDPATGTIKLKATFANGDRSLWPGSFVDVTIRLTTEPNAIVVPSQAIQAAQQGQFVYVVKPDRTVEARPVTVSRQEGAESVVSKGLSAGEEVVTDGQLRLTPGARVTTNRATPARSGS